MERIAPSHKPKHDLTKAAKTSARTTRDKRSQQEHVRPRPQPGPLKSAKDASESARWPTRDPRPTSPLAHDDPNARLFTVANVGANGLLFLQPMKSPSLLRYPASPSDTTDANDPQRDEDWFDARHSALSGAHTPRIRAVRAGTIDAGPLLLRPNRGNGVGRQRTRSHSFSTTSDRPGTPVHDSSHFYGAPHDHRSVRSRSATDLPSANLLDFSIPNPRLGTPRFSERGTAHLSTSVHSARISDCHSSAVLPQDYDKLFPRPPSKTTLGTYLPPIRSQTSRVVAQEYEPVVLPPAIRIPILTDYDEIEANVNSPAIVTYDTTTGRILAATAARLVAQITSPVFLDYELLSDFFLTYRCFLLPHDVMDYMLARMKWALNTNTDAGQIVRVRTFVALRHWILNYFADDFAPNLKLTRHFCNLVNQLSRGLQQRADYGGKVADMNILEELKKCWRRTCALFWPSSDTSDTPAGTDILPGGGPLLLDLRVSALSAASTGRPATAHLERPSSQLHAHQRPGSRASARRNTVQSFETEFAAMLGRKANIPASPMSEDSLDVLSCSVPFLRHALHSPSAGRDAPRPVASHRNKHQADAPNRPRHYHKPSGSFSDTMRDARQSLPSTKLDGLDHRSSPTIALTGGLIRGHLLQPSPAEVQTFIPVSPPLESFASRDTAVDESHLQDLQQPQNTAVKKIVGEMRRALSARRHRHDSPVRSHRSTNSASSLSSGPFIQVEKSSVMSRKQYSGTSSRVDVLGARAVDSYKNAYSHLLGQDPNIDPKSSIADVPEIDEHEEEIEQPQLRSTTDRLHSHLTTGSRSIMIGVDPSIDVDMPVMSGGLPSVHSMSSTMAPDPLRFNKQHGDYFHPLERETSFSAAAMDRRDTYNTHLGKWSQAVSDPPLSNQFSISPPWKEEHLSPERLPDDYRQRRASSGIDSAGFEMSSGNPLLRRRPGGDLKAADHVHDLDLRPRPHTSGPSLSSYGQSRMPSAVTSQYLSDVPLSGLHSWRPPLSTTMPLDLLEGDFSQSNIPPSVQAQFAHLAQLTPALDGGGGGIEDALLKLEGKMNDDPKLSRAESAHNQTLTSHSGVRASRSFASSPLPAARFSSPATDVQGASIFHPSMSDAMLENMTLQFHDARALFKSSVSGSLPVLQRGSKASKLSVHLAPFPRSPTIEEPGSVVRGAGSLEPPVKAKNRRKSPRTPDGRAQSDINHTSFLLVDDNLSLSDISSAPDDEEDHGARSFFFDDTGGVYSQHGHRSDQRSLTSPTSPTPPSLVPEPSNDLSLEEFLRNPTPPSDHRSKPHDTPNITTLPPQSKRDASDANAPPKHRPQALSMHMPFILAFESEVIAQQLTIIEKDALDEIDWKDLMQLKWVQAPPAIRDWVDYLTKQDEYNGIDIAIARFNLVVKWVVSECLLTDSAGERARCITKYIHIAGQCRRLRNFASCFQITVALLSSALANLDHTWMLVPVAEKTLLEQLEALCQPARNFHNLRAEMEAAAPTMTDAGCIPFIGLYTHDLKLNAQKPATIAAASDSGGEPLINFERHQTTAGIVKSLLRLIEASSKYVFRPHPEALSRCLWLAALEDAEISARSKALEQHLYTV